MSRYVSAIACLPLQPGAALLAPAKSTPSNEAALPFKSTIALLVLHQKPVQPSLIYRNSTQAELGWNATIGSIRGILCNRHLLQLARRGWSCRPIGPARPPQYTTHGVPLRSTWADPGEGGLRIITGSRGLLRSNYVVTGDSFAALLHHLTTQASTNDPRQRHWREYGHQQMASTSGTDLEWLVEPSVSTRIYASAVDEDPLLTPVSLARVIRYLRESSNPIISSDR